MPKRTDISSILNLGAGTPLPVGEEAFLIPLPVGEGLGVGVPRMVPLPLGEGLGVGVQHREEDARLRLAPPPPTPPRRGGESQRLGRGSRRCQCVWALFTWPFTTSNKKKCCNAHHVRKFFGVLLVGSDIKSRQFSRPIGSGFRSFRDFPAAKISIVLALRSIGRHRYLSCETSWRRIWEYHPFANNLVFYFGIR